MTARFCAALALGAATVIILACSGEPYTNTGEGMYCANGACTCLSDGDASGCTCEGSTSSSGGAPECTSDDQCPGPPDKRCGVGRCVMGRCELKVAAGKPIPNQFPGDCKLTVCSADGSSSAWTDPGDVPADNNPCTFDACDGDKPTNTVLPDKSPCPGLASGICVSGKCQGCAIPLGIITCSGGLYCAWDQCVPYQCVDDDWNGQETQTDCGGPVCHPCGDSGKCIQGSDCQSGVCTANKCKAPTTTDGVKNGPETGVDCGYPGGPPNTCGDGEGCRSSDDCESRVCYVGICQAPTCTDATQNGSETGPDCGGYCSSCDDE